MRRAGGAGKEAEDETKKKAAVSKDAPSLFDSGNYLSSIGKSSSF